jgi:hypothetical protein
MERSRRAPAFFETQRRPDCLPDDIESASFVTEDVAPAAGPNHRLRTAASESNRPGTRDHDDAASAGSCTCESDHTVVDDGQERTSNDAAK